MYLLVIIHDCIIIIIIIIIINLKTGVNIIIIQLEYVSCYDTILTRQIILWTFTTYPQCTISSLLWRHEKPKCMRCGTGTILGEHFISFCKYLDYEFSIFLTSISPSLKSARNKCIYVRTYVHRYDNLCYRPCWIRWWRL